MIDIDSSSPAINGTNSQKMYKFSELFGRTIQGEGKKTGTRTIWIRWWGCNLNCNGFGQKFPDKPDTWDLPFKNIDIKNYSTIESLPVFSKGCDSSYSWAKKFSHLAHKDTAYNIALKLREFLPGGTFKHPKSGQYTDLAITGGEPMMSQSATIDVLENLERSGDMPESITIETNGTQTLRKDFIDYFKNFKGELFWSVSPKLYISGENWKTTIKPDVVSKYKDISDSGQLKYVCDNSDRVWDEVEQSTAEYRKVGINWPVWIMPVGSDLEGQDKIAAEVAEAAIDRGYNVATRVHVYLFGNVIGK